jgi:hypothetical protein
MTISNENRRRGWTPELVEWARMRMIGPDAIGVNLELDAMRNSPISMLPLAILQEKRPDCSEATWYELLQALPAEALQQLEPEGDWQAVTTAAGKRKPGLCYRVRDDWEVGEWVEDEPEPNDPQDEKPKYVITERNGVYYRLPEDLNSCEWYKLAMLSPEGANDYRFVCFTRYDSVDAWREAVKSGYFYTSCSIPWSNEGKRFPYAVWERVDEEKER